MTQAAGRLIVALVIGLNAYLLVAMIWRAAATKQGGSLTWVDEPLRTFAYAAAFFSFFSLQGPAMEHTRVPASVLGQHQEAASVLIAEWGDSTPCWSQISPLPSPGVTSGPISPVMWAGYAGRGGEAVVGPCAMGGPSAQMGRCSWIWPSGQARRRGLGLCGGASLSPVRSDLAAGHAAGGAQVDAEGATP